MRSHVNVEIGYESSPGAFVIETRKSFGIVALAAAALTDSTDACTNLPAAFFTASVTRYVTGVFGAAAAAMVPVIVRVPSRSSFTHVP